MGLVFGGMLLSHEGQAAWQLPWIVRQFAWRLLLSFLRLAEALWALGDAGGVFTAGRGEGA